MDPRDRETLLQLRSLLLARVGPHNLTLFGSRARGDAGEDSDMDVLVVTERRDAQVEEAVSECAWEVSLARGVLIVPITYSREEWERGPERFSLLGIAVRSEGVQL